MKPEEKRTFLISASMIILLSLLSFYRIKNFDSKDFSLELPKIENTSPSPDFLNIFPENSLLLDIEDPSQKESKYVRENIDNQVSFDYPSSWFVASTNEESVENIDLHFLAYSQSIHSPTVLMIFKTPFSDFESITEIIKESLDNDGATDIVIEEDENYLITSYSAEGGDVVSRFKILLFDEYSFILSFTFFKDQKPQEDITDYIEKSFKKID